MPQIAQLPYIFSSQLFWLAVVFGIIFFGIGRGILPKVQSTLDAREKKIAEDLDRAQAARARAEATEAEWRARMDAARIEAASVAQQARQASARESEARVKSALERIDNKADLASQRIRDAVAAARTEMEAAAVEAAQEIVERLTGMKVDKKDAAEVVATEFLLPSQTATSRADRPRVPVQPAEAARG
jgi:F-type H+-transporting ATPase subunit b